MRITTNQLPKLGDYIAYQTRVYNDQSELELCLTGKLSGTELTMLLAKGSVKSEQTAQESLKTSVEKSALELYDRKAYSKGQSFEKFINIS